MATKVRSKQILRKRAMIVDPPLLSGDRLTRREFERRYSALPEIKKAELVEGAIHVAAPVRLYSSAQPHAQIIVWLGAHWPATPGVQLADNTTVRLDRDNDPQPDALLLIDPASGRRSHIAADYIEGAPELIIESAARSAAYDLHDKAFVARLKEN